MLRLADNGGSVIDLHAQLRALSIGEAMRDLTPGGSRNGSNGSRPTPAMSEKKSVSTPKPSLEGSQPDEDQTPYCEVCAYDYQDATGKIIQVLRYEPKALRQCRIVDGKRVWSMEGVERLPYRLPELSQTQLPSGSPKESEMLKRYGLSAKRQPATLEAPASGSRHSRNISGPMRYIAADKTSRLKTRA